MFSASMCLAMAIYFESAVEPSYNAGLAVAEVILNRVKHPKFEDTICGVVTEDWGLESMIVNFHFTVMVNRKDHIKVSGGKEPRNKPETH